MIRPQLKWTTLTIDPCRPGHSVLFSLRPMVQFQWTKNWVFSWVMQQADSETRGSHHEEWIVDPWGMDYWWCLMVNNDYIWSLYIMMVHDWLPGNWKSKVWFLTFVRNPMESSDMLKQPLAPPFKYLLETPLNVRPCNYFLEHGSKWGICPNNFGMFVQRSTVFYMALDVITTYK